jgi:hypothetical protein
MLNRAGDADLHDRNFGEPEPNFGREATWKLHADISRVLETNLTSLVHEGAASRTPGQTTQVKHSWSPVNLGPADQLVLFVGLACNFQRIRKKVPKDFHQVSSLSCLPGPFAMAGTQVAHLHWSSKSDLI